MSFLKLLKNENNNPKTVVITEAELPTKKATGKETPEDLLRGNGIKIRLVTPTTFGTQIDFAKKYDDNEIKEILKDFTLKFKGNSVFIVD